MIFIGTFEHTLDNKNRLVIPSKLCAKLDTNVVISKGLDNCLELRNQADFEIFVNKLEKYSDMKKDVRIVRRHLLAQAVDLEIDNAKRILIPSFLLDSVGIDKKIILIGVGDHIEIWDFKQFDQHIDETINKYTVIAEKLDDDNK